MNVLFNLPSISIYYSARFEMLKCLSKKVDNLTIVTNNKGAIGTENLPSNIEIIRLPNNKLEFSFSLLSEIDFKSTDVIHDTFGYLLPLGPVTKLCSSKRYITSVYGSSPGWLREAKKWHVTDKEEFRGHKKLLIREYLNSIFCDRVIVNSESFIKDYVEDFGCSLENIDVIPNCIVMDDEVEYPEGSGTTFNILYVGHISKLKGIYTLLDAFKMVIEAGYEAKLTVIGKIIPFDRKIIEKMNLKNVRFIEHLPHNELKQHYLNSDVYVHPSYQEGMPKTVMEALSFGLPVIASDLPGIKAIDNSGNYVRIMKDFQTESLKNMIIDEINIPRKSKMFFEEARNHMRKFSPEKTAQMIYNIYRKVI